MPLRLPRSNKSYISTLTVLASAGTHLFTGPVDYQQLYLENASRSPHTWAMPELEAGTESNWSKIRKSQVKKVSPILEALEGAGESDREVQKMYVISRRATAMLGGLIQLIRETHDRCSEWLMDSKHSVMVINAMWKAVGKHIDSQTAGRLLACVHNGSASAGLSGETRESVVEFAQHIGGFGSTAAASPLALAWTDGESSIRSANDLIGGSGSLFTATVPVRVGESSAEGVANLIESMNSKARKKVKGNRKERMRYIIFHAFGKRGYKKLIKAYEESKEKMYSAARDVIACVSTLRGLWRAVATIKPEDPWWKSIPPNTVRFYKALLLTNWGIRLYNIDQTRALSEFAALSGGNAEAVRPYYKPLKDHPQRSYDHIRCYYTAEHFHRVKRNPKRHQAAIQIPHTTNASAREIAWRWSLNPEDRLHDVEDTDGTRRWVKGDDEKGRNINVDDEDFPVPFPGKSRGMGRSNYDPNHFSDEEADSDNSGSAIYSSR